METSESLKEILKEVREVCGAFGLDSLRGALRGAESFAAQERYLDLAVLGQFKTGKSSFINGLVNKALLPVGSVPVTSVITRICSGPEEKAAVAFMDGAVREIGMNELQSYVSEAENPGNRKGVLRVDVETPALSDMGAIRLVDTPGTGSVWKHNTETTRDWFPETGGVLFVISAEKPVSESELDLLKEVSLYTPEIFIVLTKTDLFRPEQVNETEAFTAGVIRTVLHRDLPIVRYSAVADTGEYNRKMKRDIFLPLARNRSNARAEVLRHKTASLVRACLSYLDISYRASLQKEAGRQSLKEDILDERFHSSFVQRELLLIIGSYKEKTRESIQAYLEAYRSGIEERLTREFGSAFGSWKGNLYKVTLQFEQWLKQSLGSELRAVLIREEKSRELLAAVEKHLSFYIRNFRERLDENLERVLGVRMEPEEWKLDAGEIRRPDISVGRSFDFHLELFWFLFPMPLYRKAFQWHFLRQIPYEIEKNLYRLTSDLNERISRKMDHLMAQAFAYMKEELRIVEVLLTQKEEESPLALERMNRLRELAKALE
jgi:signal recognition particle receptor subunit beta